MNYGSFYGAPSRSELERYFFLDDSDLEKVRAKRRAHNRLGFAVRLTRSFLCLRDSFLTFDDGSQAVEECLEAEFEESIETQVIAVLEGSDHLGEGREAAGFHQFPESGGAAVHPLVLRLARGRFGVRFHLQVHSQALDMAALVGAHVLADCLAQANGDHRTAYARYEQRMRPFVTLNQALATENPGGPASEESGAHAKNALSLDS